jgi:hypothetical protein
VISLALLDNQTHWKVVDSPASPWIIFSITSSQLQERNLANTALRGLQYLPKMDPISALGVSSIVRITELFFSIGERYISAPREVFSILVSLDSLHDTLNLLREKNWLWVDTICIDQDHSPERVKEVLQMQRIYREHSPEELLANREKSLVFVQDFRKSSSKMCNHLFSTLHERCVKEELQRQTRNAIDSSRLLLSTPSKRRRKLHLLESLHGVHLRDEIEAMMRARKKADILRNNLVSRILHGDYRLPMADYKETLGNVFIVLQSLVRTMKDMTSALSDAEVANTTGYSCSRERVFSLSIRLTVHRWQRTSTNPVEAAVLQIPCHSIIFDAGRGTVNVVTFDVKSLQPLRIEGYIESTYGPSEASLVEKSFLAMPSGESMIPPVWGNAREVGSISERAKIHLRRSIMYAFMHAWRALAAAQILVDFAVPVEHTIHQEDESSVSAKAEQELTPDLFLDELKDLDQPFTSPPTSKGSAQLARNGVSRVRLLLLKLRFQSPTRKRSRLFSRGFGRSGLQGLLFWAAPVTATSVNTETCSSQTCSSFIDAVQVERRQLLTVSPQSQTK